MRLSAFPGGALWVKRGPQLRVSERDVCACEYACVCMCVFMCICMCTCVCLCVCVCERERERVVVRGSIQDSYGIPQMLEDSRDHCKQGDLRQQVLSFYLELIPKLSES